MWDQMVGNGSWNLKFVRPCNDWEVHLVVPFKKKLSTLIGWMESLGGDLVGVVSL